MEYVLGIDTSAYTTSLALTDGSGFLIEKRQLLDVPSGERGLRQSEAVFQHNKNLPRLFEELLAEAHGFREGSIIAVAASTRPRPREGSYMPVFMVARSYGKVLSSVLDVPFIETSHQEGHLMAGIFSGGGPRTEDFLAVHLSGGTSEILKVKRTKVQHKLFEIEKIGGTEDLHAGQFIDRVGAALGLSFPAGPALEKLAAKSFLESSLESEIKIPSSVKDFSFSFSGPETMAQKFVKEEYPPPEIARAVQQCISNTLEKVLRKAVEVYGLKEILVVGGVASNIYIRNRLRARLEHPAVGARLYFAEPKYSKDNAVGTALIGWENIKNS